MTYLETTIRLNSNSDFEKKIDNDADRGTQNEEGEMVGKC